MSRSKHIKKKPRVQALEEKNAQRNEPAEQDIPETPVPETAQADEAQTQVGAPVAAPLEIPVLGDSQESMESEPSAEDAAVPQDAQTAENDAEDPSASGQDEPKKAGRIRWPYFAVAALLLAALCAYLLLHSGVFSETTAALANRAMDRQVACDTLELSYPEKLDPLSGPNFLGASKENFLVRLEDVTEANSKQLEAGYTSQESAQALLEAGRFLVAGDGIVSSPRTELTEDVAGSQMEFSLDGERSGELVCRLTLLRVQDRDVLSLLLCEKAELQDAEALYTALLNTLRIKP